MKIFGLYKHKNNTDVAIVVVKSFYVKERDSYKLKVDWMNIVNPKNVFRLDVMENLEIPHKDFLNWELI